MTRTADPEPLIGSGELAKGLGRPESTVRLWTTKGLIPSIRMPGGRTRYLYRLSEVREALDGYRTATDKTA